jgi:hypothetical protein
MLPVAIMSLPIVRTLQARSLARSSWVGAAPCERASATIRFRRCRRRAGGSVLALEGIVHFLILDRQLDNRSDPHR